MKLHSIILSLIVGLFGIQVAANAAPTFEQKKEVEAIVHDYLLKNPEVLVQSLEKFQQKQMDQTRETFKKIQESAPKYANRLFHQAEDPVAGNPNGSITIVEFSDYQCPHCIEMVPVISNLIKNNNNLRVVFKEFPIRGPISEMATKAALASQKQGKYYEFRNALMESKTQPLTENMIFDIAKSVGLNVDKLKKDMQENSINNIIKNNYQLAKDMQLIWTPIFFIAKTNATAHSKPNAIVFVPGRVDEGKLKEVIEKISE